MTALVLAAAGAGTSHAEDPSTPPWHLILDDRTQAVRYTLIPDLTVTGGDYRGDEIFFAPFAAFELDRESQPIHWGVATALFWIDGEPYIESESRDSAFRSFLSAYVTAPLATLVDRPTSLGRLRVATGVGARADVEHVFPELSAGVALAATLAPGDELTLFTHLAPTAQFPDADYSLATTDVNLLVTPEPWFTGDVGFRLGPARAAPHLEVALHGGIGTTTSELGVRLGAASSFGLTLDADLGLTRAYGGTVDRRIASAELGWTALPSFEVAGESVSATPALGVRVGTDRFGTVEENVLEIRTSLALTWGATAHAEVGYRLDLGEVENRPARYDFDPEEQRFLDSAVRVRDSARKLVARLDHALGELASGSPEAAARAQTLVQTSAHALASLVQVVDQARRLLPDSDPGVDRLLRLAENALRNAARGLERLLADPTGLRSASAVAAALAPVRHAIDEAFQSPILGHASLDDVITGLTTVPHSFTREMGAEQINDLIHDLANDDTFGFLLSEIDVLLIGDWKDHTARGLEPVTANDVFRFFANQLADEAIGLLRDGLAEIADEYHDHPIAVLMRVPADQRLSAKRFLDSLADLRARDLVDVDALRRMLPSNTLTDDTAVTLANLINGKVLRSRKAMADFRKRLTVRGGASLDQILFQDLDP